MNAIETRTVQVNGRDVRYYQAGNGEPVVVIHGGGGDARTWENNIRELSKHYTVYAPDLPGYGGSQPLEGNYFIPELSTFINGFTSKLGLDSFFLVGHSLGGGIALNFALDFPRRIKKLVLVSSLCLGREIALWVRFLSVPALLRSVGAILMGIFSSVKWFMERLNPIEWVPPMSPACVSVGGAITTFRQQRLVLEDRLPELSVPTLLVWGEKDPIVPVIHAYRAVKSIPGALLKIFPRTGHDVHRDKLADFSHTLKGFFG